MGARYGERVQYTRGRHPVVLQPLRSTWLEHGGLEPEIPYMQATTSQEVRKCDAVRQTLQTKSRRTSYPADARTDKC
jgi:hypothetical protein